ncbi:hypothetical protein BB559_003756 [Furculomyces boomerangus]|uniref:DDE-1 domain-containing protein n=1 Tax=Furculomyces boomerangus TaxID=61424 RepID=A0A2T9YIZ9_9FUNG|nr:hypothetical protein BB559_003756 [Furculomyces boomerangus]
MSQNQENTNKTGLNKLQSLEIIETLSKKIRPSNRKIGESYGVSEGAIRKIEINSEKYQHQSGLNLKKIYFMDWKWKNGKNYSTTIARFAQGVEFCKRANIKGVSFYGKEEWINKNNNKIIFKLEAMTLIINEYEPQNIYNMDETDLFYCLVPLYTITRPNKDVKHNSTGTDKISISVVGKSMFPTFTKESHMPLPYFSQENAWMDNYYDLPNKAKIDLKELVGKMRRGSAGIEFGKHAHILDAASITLESWENISPETIIN